MNTTDGFGKGIKLNKYKSESELADGIEWFTSKSNYSCFDASIILNLNGWDI